MLGQPSRHAGALSAFAQSGINYGITETAEDSGSQERCFGIVSVTCRQLRLSGIVFWKAR
jgi:hypothetical protein